MATTSTTPTEKVSTAQSDHRPALLTWDVEEALTWVTYGFFRHLKNETPPSASELSDWWDQLLAVQVAINALIAECGNLPTGTLTDHARKRLNTALSRITASAPSLR